MVVIAAALSEAWTRSRSSRGPLWYFIMLPHVRAARAIAAPTSWLAVGTVWALASVVPGRGTASKRACDEPFVSRSTPQAV